MKLNKNLFSKGTINKVVKEDKMNRIQKELDAVNGVKVLFFEVTTIEELFSAFATSIGIVLFLIFVAILNKSSIKAILCLITGIGILCYAQYRGPIDKYKENFMNDDELPMVLDTIMAGLDAGLPLMNIFTYISKYKKSNTAKLISECVARVNAGNDFNKSLEFVAEKSFNHYFIRMAKIVKKADTSTTGLSTQLRELQKDIEIDRINKKNERVEKLDNALFFPILLGYFVPLVLMIILPLFSQIKNIQQL